MTVLLAAVAVWVLGLRRSLRRPTPSGVHDLVVGSPALLGSVAKCAPAVREVRVPSLVRRSSGGGHSTPLQCSLPGESQGQRSLAGCSPWGRTESDMTEQLSNKLLQHSFLCLPILGLYLVALGCWERCGLVEVVVLPPRSPGSVHRFSVVLLSGLGGVFLVPFSCSYSLSFQSCLTLCSPMDCSTPGFPVHHWLPELLKFMNIALVMPSSPLVLCQPLLPHSIFLSIRVWESVLCIRWPKYWRFSISPSNEYWGLISFRMDWLDLLAVQGTRKSLLQHHSSEASIFQHSASFTVQLSHPYMTTGKTIALTRRTFVVRVMSLLFNTLDSIGWS